MRISFRAQLRTGLLEQEAQARESWAVEVAEAERVFSLLEVPVELELLLAIPAILVAALLPIQAEASVAALVVLVLVMQVALVQLELRATLGFRLLLRKGISS
jgi:hypothetical protein